MGADRPDLDGTLQQYLHEYVFICLDGCQRGVMDFTSVSPLVKGNKPSANYLRKLT